MEKLVLVIFLLAGCAGNTKVIAGGDKTAILVEGLASFNAGFVRKVYKSDLEKMGYTVYSEPYTTNREMKADLCITHSFGWKAVRDGHRCKILITMDARGWDAKNNSKWETPGGNHYNFYQKKGLRGYPIKGAKNQEIKKGGHTSLPRHSKSFVMGIL